MGVTSTGHFAIPLFDPWSTKHTPQDTMHTEHVAEPDVNDRETLPSQEKTCDSDSPSDPSPCTSYVHEQTSHRKFAGSSSEEVESQQERGRAVGRADERTGGSGQSTNRIFQKTRAETPCSSEERSWRMGNRRVGSFATSICQEQGLCGVGASKCDRDIQQVRSADDGAQVVHRASRPDEERKTVKWLPDGGNSKDISASSNAEDVTNGENTGHSTLSCRGSMGGAHDHEVLAEKEKLALRMSTMISEYEKQ